MTTSFPAHFARQYDSHLKHLKLKGLQPKTIDAYARAIRRLGGYFDYRIEALTEAPSSFIWHMFQPNSADFTCMLIFIFILRSVQSDQVLR